MNGTFSTENFPALTGLLFWNINFDTTNDLVALEVISPFTADFDGDGDVDNIDLAQWENSYGVDALADADGDNDSDGADFLAWQQQFTGSLVAVAASTAVPEPSSAMILLTLAAMLLPRLRSARKTRYLPKRYW
ncbi:MAG: hypothetical protein IH831_05955 [Planctomycetes bacterium]|nr:hypothetical protein [Planctomycetota bacterium]